MLVMLQDMIKIPELSNEALHKKQNTNSIGKYTFKP